MRWSSSILLYLALSISAFWLGTRLASRRALADLETGEELPPPTGPRTAFAEMEQHLREFAKKEDLQGAEDLLRQEASLLGPEGQARLWVVLVHFAIVQNDTARSMRALDAFETLVAPDLWFDHAHLAHRTGHRDAALALLDRYLEKFPRGERAGRTLLSKASILKEDRKRAGESAALYARFLASSPDSPRAAGAGLGLGDCLVAIGDGEGAIEAYRNVYEKEGRSPKGVIAALSWAWALYRDKRRREAIQLLDSLLVDPNLPHRDRIVKTLARFRKNTP